MVLLGIGLFSFMSSSNAQTYVFKHGLNGYSSFQDVMLYSLSSNQSFGANLGVINQNANGIMKFENLGVPPARYKLTLEITARSIVSNGTVTLYYLNSLQWTDPHQNLNPPPTDSTNPTWNYRNYNSALWVGGGASGSSERGDRIGDKFINSQTTYSYETTLDILSGLNAIGFIVTNNASGEIYFESPDNTSGNSAYPKLIFTFLSSLTHPSLDGSSFFKPFQPIR